MKPELLIPIMVFIPLLSAVVLMLPMSLWHDRKNIWSFTLISTVVTFGVSLIIAFNFDWQSSAMQFAAAVPWVPAFGLSFDYGLDGFSIWFVLLTTFIMPPVVLESLHNLEGRMRGRTREFFIWLLVAEAIMIASFVATDIIFFYLCFEFSLLPLYFLIGIYGSKNRAKAATLYFIYSFTGSMLMLVGIIYVAWFHASLDPATLTAAQQAAMPQAGQWTFSFSHLIAAGQQMSLSEQVWVLIALLAGFGVKVPMFPVHTWLPLAHTEAPTAGSVDLAAVMLKIGTYAILRFAIPLAPAGAIEIAPAVATLGVIAILYAALICWVQKDLKKLIAYSSVSHMGFCVLGIFAFDAQDIAAIGSVMYMINHGLSTGALFLCVGMVYERFHTRQMADMSGLVKVMPIWAFFMVFFTMSSVGLPGLNGFVGEFLTLLGSFMASGFNGIIFGGLATLGMILAAIYLLYMVGKVVFGPKLIPSDHHGPIKDLDFREILTLAPIAVVCLILGLYPYPVLKSLESPIAGINEPAKTVLAEREGVTDTRLVTDDPIRARSVSEGPVADARPHDRSLTLPALTNHDLSPREAAP